MSRLIIIGSITIALFAAGHKIAGYLSSEGLGFCITAKTELSQESGRPRREKCDKLEEMSPVISMETKVGLIQKLEEKADEEHFETLENAANHVVFVVINVIHTSPTREEIQ